MKKRMKKRTKPKINQSLDTTATLEWLLSEFIEQEVMDGDKFIRYHQFENEVIEQYSLSIIEVEGCVFKNCKISSTNAKRATFMDCQFINCDFSNSEFMKSAFHRCEFHQCKLVGTDFSEGYLRHVLFFECNETYSNFNQSNTDSVEFNKSVMKQTSFVDCLLKAEFIECDLSGTYFFDTALEDIDFSTSEINGIVFHIDNIKGCIVNREQAIELSKLLGIHVSE